MFRRWPYPMNPNDESQQSYSIRECMNRTVSSHSIFSIHADDSRSNLYFNDNSSGLGNRVLIENYSLLELLLIRNSIWLRTTKEIFLNTKASNFRRYSVPYIRSLETKFGERAERFSDVAGQTRAFALRSIADIIVANAYLSTEKPLRKLSFCLSLFYFEVSMWANEPLK
mmetsp:Transcript_19656/g.54883  ORF Transcript_19656/g.54883 Transcript_19656/m.54883 type:complete len:170 (-) Transcript_19656:1355-1864(-)